MDHTRKTLRLGGIVLEVRGNGRKGNGEGRKDGHWIGMNEVNDDDGLFFVD